MMDNIYIYTYIDRFCAFLGGGVGLLSVRKGYRRIIERK